MRKIQLVVAGAGDRGATHAAFAKLRPEAVEIVGVAEPRESHRRRLAAEHDVPAANVFADWRALAERERFADGVVIATQDTMHVEPTEAFAARGYDILLEKPLAPDEEGCRRIVAAVKEHGVLFAVGHVLRYTAYTRKLKELLEAGAIGEIVCVNHLEPLGYWHQAHSFVRGNWRSEAESSSMLLAKACHDLDWIHHVVGKRCEAVSSFGSLKHFRAASRPEGAAERCLDCSIEAECPYSARKIYLGRLAEGGAAWPVSVVTSEATEEALTEALRTGPYGRCVYACDNDVVDNQVVSLQFEGGATATFTMTGFNQGDHRQTRIFGTRGEIKGNGRELEVFDFLTDRWHRVELSQAAADITGGHGGGDYHLMEAFVGAVASADPTQILSGPDETLESHLLVFDAERARREGRVVRR